MLGFTRVCLIFWLGEKLVREAFIEHLEFDIVVFDLGIRRKHNNCAFKDLESLGINFKPLL